MDKIIINQGINLSKDGSSISAEDLKGVFTTGIPKESKDRVKSKKARDRSWETLSSSKDDNQSSKAINKSRSGDGGEHDQFGRTTLGNSLDKIFDYKEDPFSKHAIDAGQKKRTDRELKKQRNRDWEVESRAKSTADVSATQMGFTPNRSAWEPGKLPEVNIPLVDQMIKDEEKSAQAGLEAQKMISEIYKEKMADWESKINNKTTWEEDSVDHINSIFAKEHKNESLGLKLADDLVRESEKKEVRPEFKELFTTVDGKQKSIKVDLSHLKSRKKTRKDDRSWETLENSKSKKF